MHILHYISLAIGIIGIAVMAWGSLVSFVQLVFVEAKIFRKENICKKREYVRQQLGSYILLGLEFMIAADVIRTIMQPTLQELAVLGSIVVIRTVISYFLDRELLHEH